MMKYFPSLQMTVVFTCFLFLQQNLTAQQITSNDRNELIRLSYQNPGMLVDLSVGLWASPLPMDYDQDGDTDLVISCTDVPFNGTYFFENISGKMDAATIFNKPVKIDEGIRNITVSYTNGDPRILGSGVEYQDF